MSALKLARRDDPLALGPASEEGGRGDGSGQITPPGEEDPPVESASTPEEAPTPPRRAQSQSNGVKAAETRSGGGPYDEDRLAQAGWRMFESVIEQVREQAAEVSAAGAPASAASYAAAVLALRAPETVIEREQLMREWHQLTSSRRARPRQASV